MASLITNIALGIAFLAMVMLFFRLVIGTTTIDRVIAIDALTIVSISFMAYIAVYTGREIYLDVAMVYALMSFIGVIALARYVERGL